MVSSTKRPEPLLAQKNTKARLLFAKNKNLDYHPDLQENVLWTEELKLDILYLFG